VAGLSTQSVERFAILERTTVHQYNITMVRIRSKTLLVIALLSFMCVGTAQETEEETTGLLVDEDDLVDLDVLEEVLLQSVSKNDTTAEATIVNITVEDSNMPTEAEIKVKSNLESMTDTELEALCKERGYEVSSEGGRNLTHNDYVKAAERCISLEMDEMNDAILVEKSDPSADLEDEIELMRLEKVRLEEERDSILAEKAALEEQLRRSGVDPSSIAGAPAFESAAAAAPTKIQTVDEVLRESFVLLFDRVGKDMRLVGGGLRFLFRPVGGGVQLVWRYTAPTVEGLIKKAITLTETVLEAEQISLVRRTIGLQWKAVSKVAAHVLKKTQAPAQTVARVLYQREEIRKVSLIVEAFFGPLSESLLSGWRSIQPDVEKARTTAMAWIQRLKDERDPPEYAQQAINSMRKST
jgi:hypothetical protein